MIGNCFGVFLRVFYGGVFLLWFMRYRLIILFFLLIFLIVCLWCEWLFIDFVLYVLDGCSMWGGCIYFLVRCYGMFNRVRSIFVFGFRRVLLEFVVFGILGCYFIDLWSFVGCYIFGFVFEFWVKCWFRFLFYIGVWLVLSKRNYGLRILGDVYFLVF